jgi:hypothetical protein
MSLVDDEYLILEVDAECFSSVLLKKQVVWQSHQLY